MSRIGRKPIEIPASVKVEIKDQDLKVLGPLGGLARKVDPSLCIEFKDGKILISPKEKEYSKKVGAVWGLFRAIVANMVLGVTKGFAKKLEIEGIGYKAAIEGQDLVLNVGFTHPVRIKGLSDVKFSVEKNIITISGIDKEKVGQMAAIIRKVKKAEPYKGKGLKYVGEKVRRKEGKKVVATAK